MDKRAITMAVSENPVPDEFAAEKQEFSQENMKKCPFCAELIQPEAIKCRYCGEFLHGFRRTDIRPKSNKWYFSTLALVGLIIFVGPLAIPAIWLNPRYKILTKVIITVVVILLTVLLVYLMVEMESRLLNQFNPFGL